MKNARPSRTAVDESKARDALAKFKEQLSEDTLWQSKIRSRQIEAMVRSLTEHADKMASTTEDHLHAFGSELVEFATQTKAKFEFFSNLRKGVEVIDMVLTDEAISIVRTIQHHLLTSIFTWSAHQILKDVEAEAQNWVARACVVLLLDNINMI